jgi:hypothetical protein
MGGRRQAQGLLALVLCPLCFLCFLCLLCLAGCPRPKPAARPAEPADAPDPRARWYQLQAGALVGIDGPGSAAPAQPLPWTVQARVADMAFVGTDLYCGLNGIGLARLRFDPDGLSETAYFADPLLFGNRTITTLLPGESGLTVHLYYNALLNTVAPERLPIRGVSLVTFLPDRQDYALVITPFHRKNPLWEAVGFVPVSREEYLFEWKSTEAEQTRFAYTRYFPLRKSETAAERSRYIAASAAAVETLGAGSARRKFLESCLAELRASSPGCTALFELRAGGDAPRRMIRAEGEGQDAATIPVQEEKAGWRALLPGGRVLSADGSGRSTVTQLPAVPAGVRYTDLLSAGSLLVVPWEQRSFTQVGAAGILLYKIEG